MFYRNVRVALGASAVALLLAACSGGGSPSPGAAAGVPGLPQSQQMRSASHSRIIDSLTGRIGLPASFHGLVSGRKETSPGWLSDEAKSAVPKAYVSDFNANAIYIFNAKTPGSPIGTITNGVNEPLGSFVASDGSLYVAELGANTVTVYPKGATSPSKTYSSGLSEPIGVAVGKDGTLYVSEYVAGAVVEYAKGTSTPTRTITISGPEGVALDNKNNLYVSYSNANSGAGGVEKFAPKATTGTDLGIAVDAAGDLKLDKKNDILLEDQVVETVNFYKPGATSPYGTVSVGGDAYKLALNQAETLLYVADTTNVPYYQAKPSGALEGTVSAVQSAYGISLSPPPPLDETL